MAASSMISLSLRLGILFCTGVLLSLACIDTERLALLRIKQSMQDPLMKLSSWNDTMCCRWPGVHCWNGTGPVIRLDLGSKSLGGELSPSLLELSQLRSLNLSTNDFNGSRIPEFIGAFPRLKYLDLSNSNFGELVPYHLGNLSTLLYLDIGLGKYPLLRQTTRLLIEDLSWVLRLTSLRYLALNGVNLSRSTEWLFDINKLTRLSELRLSATNPSNIPHSIEYLNLTSLTVLDLSHNWFNTSLPHWLFNMSKLSYLDLSWSAFVGTIPDLFYGMNSLAFIDLQVNFLYGSIPKSMGNLCSLESLDLSLNNVTGEMTGLVDGLSMCNSGSAASNLTVLDLSHNAISGPITRSIGKLSSLAKFSLRNNNMSGEVPEAIGKLSKLGSIDITSNMFVGDLVEGHFENLEELTDLRISYNSLALKVSSGWSPPFQLDIIDMADCRVGPLFPQWLRTQKNFTMIIDMSNASISDTIPSWFWSLTPEIITMNFSTNNISGRLPPSLESISIAILDLSFNFLEGSLPRFNQYTRELNLYGNSFYGQLPSDIGTSYSILSTLILGKNSISGAIPKSICQLELLQVIDLSNNLISGELPDCWQGSRFLMIMDLGNNNISGNIPASLGSGMELMSLHLNNNSLSGGLPTSLMNCTFLFVLDLGDNKLSGTIPSWIGKSFSRLMILRLHSNRFSGSIPNELSLLPSLRILDLGSNNLSGVIPDDLGEFMAMKTTANSRDIMQALEKSYYYDENVVVLIKGIELRYSKTLKMMTSIDLSGNRLEGSIPDDLTTLLGLHFLNLSQNLLTGGIPKNIGKLNSLESLDLSRNQLSGPIPPSVSALNYLSNMNLSYNNLQGRIPTGSQLQTLDELSYIGNPKLCGKPLTTPCPGDVSPANNRTEIPEDDEDGSEMKWVYSGLAPGFALGVCILWGAFLIRSSWRLAYIQMIDKLFLWICATITWKSR